LMINNEREREREFIDDQQVIAASTTPCRVTPTLGTCGPASTSSKHYTSTICCHL
jgi:hypothetical protein